MSPVMLSHHVQDASNIYVTAFSSTGSQAMRADLSAACSSAGTPYTELTGLNDQWTQDYFETGYMSMPAAGGGQKLIRVYFRSPNHTGALRAAGKVVYTYFDSQTHSADVGSDGDLVQVVNQVLVPLLIEDHIAGHVVLDHIHRTLLEQVIDGADAAALDLTGWDATHDAAPVALIVVPIIVLLQVCRLPPPAARTTTRPLARTSPCPLRR